MTDEEKQRLRDYNDRLMIAEGHISVLKEEERNDLADLIRKWLEENEVPVNG